MLVIIGYEHEFIFRQLYVIDLVEVLRVSELWNISQQVSVGLDCLLETESFEFISVEDLDQTFLAF